MIEEATSSALDICFKGERDYLHGTDIIPALLRLIGPMERISFHMHRLATWPLLARWVDCDELEVLRQRDELCLLVICANGKQQQRTMVVVEDRSRTISQRLPYDEARVVARAVVSGKTIVQERAKEGNLIERIVALNKALIHQVALQEPLLLMRLDLLGLPASPQELQIILSRVIGGQTFISTISADGKALGTIYFAKSPA